MTIYVFLRELENGNMSRKADRETKYIITFQQDWDAVKSNYGAIHEY